MPSNIEQDPCSLMTSPGEAAMDILNSDFSTSSATSSISRSGMGKAIAVH